MLLLGEEGVPHMDHLVSFALLPPGYSLVMEFLYLFSFRFVMCLLREFSAIKLFKTFLWILTIALTLDR